MSAVSDFFAQWAKNYSGASRGRRRGSKPQKWYGQVIGVLGTMLVVAIVAMQFFGAVSITGQIKASQQREAAAAEKARCAKNPWALDCADKR